MFNTLIQFVAQHLLYFALHMESTSFPKPLPPKEERLCFEQMSNGDSEARDKLVEHNLRLVAHIIKKYYSSTNDQDDLISIGTIGLIKAVGTFDYRKGTRFATYASKCIENEILMHFRNVKKTAGDVYISDVIDTDKDGNSLSLIDVISDEVSVADTIDLKLKSEKLHQAIQDCLMPREKQVILLRYGISGKRPMTQREVAKQLGISRSYVSRIEKKAIGRLRQRF